MANESTSPDTVSKKVTDDMAAWAQVLERAPEETFVLRLYVTGIAYQSVRAIENIKAICKQYLPGRCDLKIVDVRKHPSVARSEQIVAAPTLVKAYPLPLRRMVGDLSDTDRVLAGLGLAHN